MSIREGSWQSKNDREFILRSLRSGRRGDGRKTGDMRLLRMVFARAEGQASAEVQLGRTRILAVVSGEVGGGGSPGFKIGLYAEDIPVCIRLALSLLKPLRPSW